jgi:hypothetical protein
MVSIYENCLTPRVYGDVTEDEAFDFIRKNKNAKKVRDLYQTDRYQKEKVKLPGWTPAGKFKPTRGIDNLEQPSGYVYFDLDKYTDKQIISEIPEVKAVWYSLSGNGLGGLFKSDTTRQNYTSTYNAFAEKYNLPVDKTSDISRFNILSFDEDIIVKDNPSVFPTIEPELKTIITYNGVIDNPKYESCRLAYEYCIKKRNYYIMGNIQNFYVMYFSVTNSFGVDILLALQYLKQKRIEQKLSDSEDFFMYEKAQYLYSRFSNMFNSFENESLLHTIIKEKNDNLLRN